MQAFRLSGDEWGLLIALLTVAAAVALVAAALLA